MAEKGLSTKVSQLYVYKVAAGRTLYNGGSNKSEQILTALPLEITPDSF